jgi:hypothetical protein
MPWLELNLSRLGSSLGKTCHEYIQLNLVFFYKSDLNWHIDKEFFKSAAAELARKTPYILEPAENC